MKNGLLMLLMMTMSVGLKAQTEAQKNQGYQHHNGRQIQPVALNLRLNDVAKQHLRSGDQNSVERPSARAFSRNASMSSGVEKHL